MNENKRTLRQTSARIDFHARQQMHESKPPIIALEKDCDKLFPEWKNEKLPDDGCDPITLEPIPKQNLVRLRVNGKLYSYDIITLKRHIRGRTHPCDPLTGVKFTESILEHIEQHPVDIPDEIKRLEADADQERTRLEEQDVFGSSSPFQNLSPESQQEAIDFLTALLLEEDNGVLNMLTNVNHFFGTNMYVPQQNFTPGYYRLQGQPVDTAHELGRRVRVVRRVRIRPRRTVAQNNLSGLRGWEGSTRRDSNYLW